MAGGEAHAAFKTPEGTRAPKKSSGPPRIPAKKRKRTTKKRTRKRKLTAKQIREGREDLFPPSFLQQRAPKLESIYLRFRNNDQAVLDLPDETLALKFKEELAKWQALEPHQVEFFAPSFREAMLSLIPKTSEAAAIAIETTPKALLKLWCDRLEADIAILEAGSRSFVKSFIDKLPGVSEPTSPHPRGEIDPESDEAPSFASFSTSETEIEDSSASVDDRYALHLCLPPPECARPHLFRARRSVRPPQKRGSVARRHRAPSSKLRLTSDVRAHLRRLKRTNDVRKLDSRTVDWISDMFWFVPCLNMVRGISYGLVVRSNNSDHIRKIVEGNHRDIKWAQPEFRNNCVLVLSLFDKVKMREEAGDLLSKEAKVSCSLPLPPVAVPCCYRPPNFFFLASVRFTLLPGSQAKMLKSESRLLAKIRESLHVLRLGRIGAANFRRKVEDERARASFEEASGSSKAYKLFTKELEETRKRDVSRYAALRMRRSSSAGVYDKRATRVPRRRLSRSAPAARPRREEGQRRFRQPRFGDYPRPRGGARPTSRSSRPNSYPPQPRGARRY